MTDRPTTKQAHRKCSTCGMIRSREHAAVMREAKAIAKLVNAIGWHLIDELIGAFR